MKPKPKPKPEQPSFARRCAAAAGWRVVEGSVGLVVALAAALMTGQAVARAATEGEPVPAGAAASAVPDLRLPDMNNLRLGVPLPVRAATAALGLGRARLALVVGIGTVDGQVVVDAALRDAAAVAAALRAGGFVVMAREELGARELRDNLREFRERLQSGAIGFVYVAALGAQVDGQNLLLPRDARLPAGGDAQALAAAVQRQGVPLSEVIDAVMGTPDSPRLLVVDAAHAHPVLARLPQPGLAEPRLPPGTMALLASAPGAVQPVAAVAALPEPVPTDPRELAATPFARELTRALLNPRATGPQVLRGTRHALNDSTGGRINPWVGGNTADDEELAEAQFLHLLPRTPEEAAREAARQMASAALRAGRGGAGASTAAAAGDLAVAAVLEQGATRPEDQTLRGGEQAADGSRRLRPEAGDARPPGSTAASAGGVGGVGSTLAGAAGAVATVAAAATTAAGTAASTTLVAGAAAGAATSTATAVAGAGAGVAANAVALGSRLLPSGAAESAAAGVVAPSVAPSVTPVVTPVVASSVAAARTADGAATAPPSRAAVTAAAGDLPVELFASRPAPVAPAPAGVAAAPARRPAPAPPPVRIPRVNPHGYTEGDTYTYQVRDTWRDEVTSTYVHSVESVTPDGSLLGNGAQMEMDPEGRLRSVRQPDGSLSVFEPAQALWWARPERGQSRRVKFREHFERAGSSGHIDWEGLSNVGRARTVRTPAGTFEALPIQTTGWFTERPASGASREGRWTRTVWYATRLGHPVAIDIEDVDRAGKLLRRERVELLHAQSSRAQP